MKGIITGASQEGMLFIRPTEFGNVIKEGMEVEISISAKTTIEPKKKDDILVFHFKDCNYNTRVIKITEKQYKFLRELTDISNSRCIDIDGWEEGCPEEDDLTDMC